MKCVALTDLPDGTPAGRVVDLHADAVTVLMTVGSVRAASDDEAQAAVAEASVDRPSTGRSRYRRRDLAAATA